MCRKSLFFIFFVVLNLFSFIPTSVCQETRFTETKVLEVKEGFLSFDVVTEKGDFYISPETESALWDRIASIIKRSKGKRIKIFHPLGDGYILGVESFNGDSAGQTEIQTRNQIAENSSLKVKGFYLGMNIQEAIAQIEKISGRSTEKMKQTYDEGMVLRAEDGSITISTDPAGENRISKITFHDVNGIFGTVVSDSFVRGFTEAYDIPPMTKKQKGNVVYYEYYSEDGFRVYIDKYRIIIQDIGRPNFN